MQPYCDKHFGHVENIRELCEFKRDMTQSGSGTIALLWTAIGKKVSKGMVITITIIIVGLMSTLFGLVYRSNITMLHEMAGIKSGIALINDKLK